jgi:hypothetical protein
VKPQRCTQNSCQLLTDEPELNAQVIVETLNRHDVRYIVIGGYGVALHRVPLPLTRDIDITPDPGRDNVNRLSAALHELGARIRVEGIPEGLVFEHNGESLSRSAAWNLTSRHGMFDVSFVPSGTRGYEDLAQRAVAGDLNGVPVIVADLEDIIRSKEAADRPKDRLVMSVLKEALERRRELEQLQRDIEELRGGRPGEPPERGL